MKTPRIGELTKLIKALKRDIGDEYRVEGQDDDIPTMQITIGCNTDTGGWSYQTGDNSFTGGAYGYPVWGVGYITRRCRSRDVAQDIIDQIRDNQE